MATFIKNRFSYVEILSTIAAPLLLGGLLWRLIDNEIPLLLRLPILCISFFAGFLLSDFLSGIAHWLADRYGRLDHPLFGSFILFFRVHHLLPLQMTTHTLCETIGVSCLIVNFFGFLALMFFPTVGSSLRLLFLTGSLFFLNSSLAGANYFHKMAHLKEVPKAIKFLQKYRIILSPDHHAVHHTNPYDTYYCITTGWMNPFLFKIGFFPKLEKVIFFFTGVKGGDYELEELKQASIRMLAEYNGEKTEKV